MNSIGAWIRGLPDRHGKTTLILLVAILVLGFGLRAYRVVEPLPEPGDDSRAYYALSKALYEEGSFGGPSFRDSSDWSPGAPLLFAAAYYATGGAREGTARIVELLLGMGAIVVVYLLGRRINCRPAGLLGAFGVAVYPPFIHSTGALFSEPAAILTLPAAVLGFLWAGNRERLSAWLLPGLLFGLTALIRPEYMVVGVAFAALAALRIALARSWKPGLAASALLLAGLLLPILPWTVRNAIVLDRLVPISTGGGKALYTGTFLPADGEYQRVKARLAERYLGRELEPGSVALDRVDPAPLFDRVARERYPQLPRDEALGRAGRENLSKFLGEDPAGYAAMTARKVWRMWSSGIGEAMSSTAGRAVQVLIVLLGLAGLALLAMRKRWWELIAMAAPLVIVTAVGAASLAAPRRNEVLMTLVFPLAGAALSAANAALSSRRSWQRQPSSRPS